ncbi:MAG: LPS export ABC transporter ATP-binding protein [Xanthobacteraceae bacterium]|nr:LPS export ABC transporter ATP-binding protein [Xanthobacteraceae bacterium]
MVDLLRMFRRHPVAPGKQGFGRAVSRDITSLGDRMGDMFKSVVGQKPQSRPLQQPQAQPKPQQRAPQPQPAPASDQWSQYGGYDDVPLMLADEPPAAYARPAPAPVPREPSREPPRELPRQERRPAQPQQPAQRQNAAPRQQTARTGYLAVHGIEKSFGTRKVVRGINIYVRRGEAVGLLGPNGAGKTTAFYMITGLIKADKGRIELDGHDVTNLPMYQRARLGIGYLPQEASIFRGLTVEENIRAVLEVAEPDRKQREYQLDSLLEEFHITRLRKSPSIALSGGERRRVEIARALATKPNYMLLDEPFAGIDPIAVGDIQQLVRHLTNRGIGVLITDHNVRETLGLTDRAYIVYAGEVLTEGNPEDIVNDPDVRRLYLGEEFRL